jgi:hypothetical protein
MELLSTEYRRCISNGKQHNRGQDGAGFASIKLDMEPGEDILVECDQSCSTNPRCVCSDK